MPEQKKRKRARAKAAAATAAPTTAAKPDAAKPKQQKKAPSAAEYLRRLKATAGSGPDGYSMFDADDVPQIKEFLPSGVLAIDKLLGLSKGGWPVGGICEVAAWEHVAKSVILDQSIAHCQRIDGIACLLDTEKGRTQAWSRLLGVDASKLILARQADTLEQAFAEVERIISVQEQISAAHKGVLPPMLLAWDSLGGMPSKAELEGAPDDHHMAVAAKVIKMNFRRLVQRLAKARIALVFTNHFYNKIGGYGGGLETYGGGGIKYYTHARLWLSKPGQIEIGGEVIGHIVRVRAKKNRVLGERVGPYDTAMVYGAGIDNSYSLHEWGLDAKQQDGAPWIERHGQWFRLRMPGTGELVAYQRKFLGLGEILTARPDVYVAMAAAYLEAP
jgi:RecA/RadA recombinase